MLEDGLGGSQIMYVMNRYLWKSGDDGHLSKQGVQACDMSLCLEAGEGFTFPPPPPRMVRFFQN